MTVRAVCRFLWGVGFEIRKEPGLIANSDDDLTLMACDELMYCVTDRFLFRNHVTADSHPRKGHVNVVPVRKYGA